MYNIKSDGGIWIATISKGVANELFNVVPGFFSKDTVGRDTYIITADTSMKQGSGSSFIKLILHEGYVIMPE